MSPVEPEMRRAARQVHLQTAHERKHTFRIHSSETCTSTYASLHSSTNDLVVFVVRAQAWHTLKRTRTRYPVRARTGARPYTHAVTHAPRRVHPLANGTLVICSGTSTRLLFPWYRTHMAVAKLSALGETGSRSQPPLCRKLGVRPCQQ